MIMSVSGVVNRRRPRICPVAWKWTQYENRLHHTDDCRSSHTCNIHIYLYFTTEDTDLWSPVGDQEFVTFYIDDRINFSR